MHKFNLTILLLFCFNVLVFSQTSIQSTVFDASNGMPIELGSVRLLRESDSTLVQGCMTDSKGSFFLSKIKNGNYILKITTVGYVEYNKSIVVNNKNIILKNIQLKEDAKLLKEVDVKGTAAQLVVKGDTLEYNATAFKTAENAPVEELFKKMPGVEISTDGKLTVNGEVIKKIRIDGKKFFDGDIEQVTKNLPADMIDKIQVIEQKSEMSQLTGFDDGDTERIINLTTKTNRRKGLFGNVGAGGGFDINNDFRYDSNMSINKMNGDKQTTINAAANNINTSRSSRGRGSWGGGSNAGVTETQNFGLNNNTIVNPKLKFGGDLTINHSDNTSNTNSSKTSYLSEITYNDNNINFSNDNKYDANARFELEWDIDSLRTLILQPSFNYNTSKTFSSRDYIYYTEGDSTSWGKTVNDGASSSISGDLNIIYNRKFNSKKGRTLTTNISTGFSQTNKDTYNKSDKYTTKSERHIDQFTNNQSESNNMRVKISYVEPLWNLKNMIEISASASRRSSSSVKNQFGKDPEGNYTDTIYEYSNNFENQFYRETIELNYRYTEKTYNLMLGINGEPSQTKNIRTYGNGFVSDTTYGVFNFAPTARFQFNFTKKKFARFDYRGRTEQPSISQMQPVKNNNDLMSETVGNPLLEPSFDQSLRLMFSSFNDSTFSSFNTYLSASGVKDAFISNKIYDNTLKQYNQTINSNEIPLYLNWNIMFNTPIIKKRLHFNTSTFLSYRTQYSYIKRNVNNQEIDIDNLLLGDLSKTRTYSGSQNLSFTFTHDVIELGIRGRLGYSNSLNNLRNEETVIWDWTGTGNIVIRFPYNFTMSSDIGYSDRAGYTNLDQSEVMWNASLDKTFLNNKATVSFRATDLLRQRLNIRQTVGDNYIQYTSYNTLPSYFLLSFTYKINEFGGSKGSKKEMRFGPGMQPSGDGERYRGSSSYGGSGGSGGRGRRD